MKDIHLKSAAAVAAAVVLGGCSVHARVAAPEPAWYYDAPARPAPRVYYEAPRAHPSAILGVVDRIEIVKNGGDEAFRVTVRLDNGAFQAVMLARVVDLRIGDRVRVEGNTIFHG